MEKFVLYKRYVARFSRNSVLLIPVLPGSWVLPQDLPLDLGCWPERAGVLLLPIAARGGGGPAENRANGRLGGDGLTD